MDLYPVVRGRSGSQARSQRIHRTHLERVRNNDRFPLNEAVFPASRCKRVVTLRTKRNPKQNPEQSKLLHAAKIQCLL